jgi:lactate 2-monooxygenase
MSINYGLYQTEIYGKAAMTGSLPIVTTDTTQLEAQAKKAMSARAYNYIAGGAGEMATMDANRLAFRQWKL